MSAQEKVARYLQDRKKLVETRTIATHFLLSISTISKALMRLENEGKTVRQKIGNTTYWSWKREDPRAMAIPRTTAFLSSPPAYKQQSSYPHIRGYDD